jgi:hypothetical protein
MPLLGIYSKKMNLPLHKDICTPTFIAALFTKAPSTLTHTEDYYLTLKKKEILPFATQTDLKDTVLSKIS